MNNVPFDEIKNISHDANEMWTLWKSFFSDILNKHAPITYVQVKGNKIPYVTSELKAMIRQRDYLRAKANKIGPSVLRQAYSQVRAKVNQKLYELQKTITLARLNNMSMTLKIHGKYLKLHSKSFWNIKLVSHYSESVSHENSRCVDFVLVQVKHMV